MYLGSKEQTSLRPVVLDAAGQDTRLRSLVSLFSVDFPDREHSTTLQDYVGGRLAAILVTDERVTGPFRLDKTCFY